MMEESQRNQKYQICLILTDGLISDIEETKDAIVELSDYPISIIIIGIGEDDFEEMSLLDADTCALYSNKL